MKLKYLERLYTILNDDYNAAKELYMKHPGVWEHEMLKRAQNRLEEFKEKEWKEESGA